MSRSRRRIWLPGRPPVGRGPRAPRSHAETLRGGDCGAVTAPFEGPPKAAARGTNGRQQTNHGAVVVCWRQFVPRAAACCAGRSSNGLCRSFFSSVPRQHCPLRTSASPRLCVRPSLRAQLPPRDRANADPVITHKTSKPRQAGPVDNVTSEATPSSRRGMLGGLRRSLASSFASGPAPGISRSPPTSTVASGGTRMIPMLFSILILVPKGSEYF